MVLRDRRSVNFYTSILQLCYERDLSGSGSAKTIVIGLYYAPGRKNVFLVE